MEKMLLKDARVLFNYKQDAEGKHRISEVLVEEFTEDHNPQHLYNHYSSDFGNCNFAYWHLIEPLEVVVMLMVAETFINEEVAEKAYKELCKIHEVKEALKRIRAKIELSGV